MKVLFAAPEKAWGGFLGLIRNELTDEDFQFTASGGYDLQSLAGYDILIPTMAKIDEALLATADKLRLIQQCGSGLEGVDIEAARRRNIMVTNVPTDSCGNADSVAELGIYMMIGLARNFRAMAKNFAEGRIGEPQGMSLSGKTVGLIGLGGIGRALVKRLQAFGVRIMAVKRSEPEKARRELGLDWVGGPSDLNHLLAGSDFVILALPPGPATLKLINAETLGRMRAGAFLINLARGGLVDHQALKEALASGRLAGAGLDVFTPEPPAADDPLFLENVLVTPHIGGSTDVSMQGIVKVVANNFRLLAQGSQPLYTK